MMLSTVQLFAAGFEGTEQIQLLVDDVAVETYSLNDGAALGQFDTLTFETPDTIAADQVRVAFVNDQYDPDAGIDSNVRLDAISIDGVRFETEDPAVFSTGTWLAVDGVQPGFRQSEILHSNGYFQFAGGAVEPPSGDVNVVINEIHYNPGPDGVVDSDAEFVELYNAGDSTVDLSGMSFTGFDLTFAAGTTLGAGEYAIVSPSIAIAQAQWGVTPIAEFAGGGISGGGETIQLLAADGVTVVDEVTYDDVAPWAGSPDGNGPSLELIDPTLDNTLAESWGASNGDPTPAAENSIFGGEVGSPISDIAVTPGTPLANTDFAISATIEGATTATLTYKVMFGEDVVVDMVNVGGDVWSATVPGQDAGALVRYRIDSDVAVAPFAGDTINYLGVVVAQSDIVDNNLPIFQFFVDEAEFETLTTTELALTNTRIAAVVVYGDQVLDNATVRVRGGDFSRTNFPKKSLKFELPKGYTLDFGTGYGVDEFGINADYSDWTFAATDITWDVWNAESKSQTNSFNLRVENNGDFHGVFRFQELYDGGWRTFNDFKDDEFYKADTGGFGEFQNFDKKSPDDGDLSSITQINDVLFQFADGSEAKRAWLYENVNVPAVVNHMALSALTRHDDQRFQNFYMALDAESGLWEIIEWDLDRLWIANEDSPTDFTDVSFIDEPLMNAIFAVPEFEQMYWRRMQTLVDTYLSPEGQAALVARRNELIDEIGATNSTLEFEKWGRVDIFVSDFFANEWVEVLQARADAFANESRLPGTATGGSNIVITELHYNPAGDDAEFIELFNNSNESIDLSGWAIDGIGLDIEFGTVLLPNERIVFTDNMPQFRNQYTGNIFVGGQYSGGLSGGGETVTLLDADGVVVDVVTYDDAAPWATSPDGDGFTLALIDVNQDNDVASNWQASNQINGTPGLDNSAVVATTSTVKVFAAGELGDEIISVELANGAFSIFDLGAAGGQAGDLLARNFIEFSFIAEGVVEPGDVRVNFLNDSFDPATGIGRDVAIDRIEINGVVYETEDPSVFSTGTYSAAGLVPGFLESEVLQTNGYFQYAEPAVIDPNLVRIRAAGTTGLEIFNLEIAGTVVATYDLSELGGQAGDLATGNFIELTYASPVAVSASDVRINFINDVYDEANGIDYNVGIDNIKIGDTVYETEAPTTYSTGTWEPVIGVVPGFKQSEVLTNAGYFQYLFDPAANNDPVAEADSFTTDEGVAVSGNVLVNDSDADQDVVSVVSNTAPASGTAVVNSDGSFVYTPNPGFSGLDSFQYSIDDGNGGTDSAEVTISVTAAPVDVFANGNTIQLLNVQFDAFLASDSRDAITTRTDNGLSQWTLIDPDGDGQYYLRNAGNGRFLDGDRRNIKTSASQTGIGKLWRFDEISPGQYHLYNVYYNEIVDANGSFADVAWDPGSSESDDLWTVTVV